MNNPSLGIRGHEIADLSPVIWDAEAIDPGLSDGLARRVIIKIAFVGLGGIKFIHTLVIDLLTLERTGLIG